MTMSRYKHVFDVLKIEDIYGLAPLLHGYPPEEDSFNFTLGGDIEGLILNKSGNGFIPAKNTQFNSTSPTAWVGKDGAGDQVEFRFKPDKNPYKVIQNFKKSINIFKEWALKGNSKGVVFGYNPYSKPVGGHIHFGMVSSTNLIKKFDYYLAIPLLIISDTRELTARCKGSYGKLSATENKSYGFEYRTLGSFPITEELATEVYVLAGLIADQHKNLMHFEITDEISENYYNGRKDYFCKNHIERIKEELFGVALYRFKKWGWALLQLINFFKRIDCKHSLISSKREVLNGWKVLKSKNEVDYKVLLNSDEYLRELKPKLLNNTEVSTNLKGDMMIYGVKNERSKKDYEIWLNSEMFQKIQLFMSDDKILRYNITEGCFGVGREFQCALGLSYKLRKLLNEESESKKAKRWLKNIQEVIRLCVE